MLQQAHPFAKYSASMLLHHHDGLFEQRHDGNDGIITLAQSLLEFQPEFQLVLVTRLAAG
jgi:hypothetical protein